MNKKIILIAAVAGLIAVSCNTKTAPVQEEVKPVEKVVAEENVPFEEAKNYFVKNTYKSDTVAHVKITSQKEFDTYFGMATTMGKNGTPTPIDFTKQYVIAIIGKKTNNEVKLTPVSLIKKENKIDYTYKLEEGKKQSFTSQPALLILVNNQEQGDLTITQAV